ncbi:hypothetical protein CFP56_037825, partial [Quercus suber]
MVRHLSELFGNFVNIPNSLQLSLIPSNDYKLVRFSYSKELKDQIYSEVDAYSLSTNSWRRKDMLVPGVVFENSFSKAVINVALHWRGVAKKRGFYSFLILSFEASLTLLKKCRIVIVVQDEGLLE